MSDSSQSQISYWRLLWPGAYLRRILRSDDFYQALQAHIKQSVPGKLLLPALILFYCTGGRLAIALSGVLVLSLLLALLFWIGMHDDWSEWAQRLSDLLPPVPLLAFALLLREIQKLLLAHSLPALRKQDSSNSLVYLHSERPELVGRDEELEKLQAFCSPTYLADGDDDKLKIVFLVAPGGYGKSRLADEFCREHLPPGWRGGVVGGEEAKESSSEGKNKKPYFLTQPSVVIFDYGDLQVGKLAASLQQLERSQQLSGVPMRLIALARSFSVGNLAYQALQQELQDKYNKPSGWLDEHCHQPLCLSLLALTATNNQKLLENILSKRGADDAQKQWAIRQLAALQEQRKDSTFPLAVYMLAAVALRQGPTASGATLDWQQLLQHCLDHEQQQWWTNDTNSTEREAIKTWAFALAVAAGPYSLSVNGSKKLSECLAPVLECLGAQDCDPKQYLQRYRAAQGGLCGLQPDLLAEYFAVQFYKAAQEPDANQELEPKFQQLLKDLLRSFPKASSSFSQRLAQDFSDSALNQSLAKMEGDNPLAVAIRANEARARGDLGVAERGLERLEEFGSQGMRFAAMVGFNLIIDHGEAQNFDKAETIYKKLKKLNDEHPSNGEIALEQAKAAVNLINYYYGNAQKLNCAKKLYQQTKKLREKHLDNDDIALAQANASHNLIRAYANAENFECAEEIYQELQELSKRNPRNGEIGLVQAKAAVNLIAYYGSAQDFNRAEALYQQLQDLSKKNPSNGEIVLEQAKAAFNLIAYHGSAQNFNRAEELYQQLRDLSKQHPSNGEIVLEQAKAAVNLMIAYHGSAQNFNRAEELYQELQELSKKNPGNGEMTLAQAQAAVKLINAYSGAQNFNRAEELYQELQKLSKKHPSNGEMALAQAKAAVNLIAYYGRTQNFNRAEELYQQLQGLSKQHPGNSEIVLEQAQAAVNLTACYGRTQNFNRAEELYQQLQDLSQKHPDNSEIVLRQARAALALTLCNHQAQKPERAAEYHQQLKQVCAQHPAVKAEIEALIQVQSGDSDKANSDNPS